MVELVEITEENFETILKLQVKPAQTDYIPETAVFLARAYLNLKAQHLDYCFGLSENHKILGFTKIVLVPAHEAPLFLSDASYLLDALLIDAKYQGKGYGKESLSKILEFALTYPMGAVNAIHLMCHVKNNEALKLYEKMGFRQRKNHKLANEELVLLERKIC